MKLRLLGLQATGPGSGTVGMRVVPLHHDEPMEGAERVVAVPCCHLLLILDHVPSQDKADHIIELLQHHDGDWVPLLAQKMHLIDKQGAAYDALAAWLPELPVDFEMGEP